MTANRQHRTRPTSGAASGPRQENRSAATDRTSGIRSVCAGLPGCDQAPPIGFDRTPTGILATDKRRRQLSNRFLIR